MHRRRSAALATALVSALALLFPGAGPASASHLPDRIDLPRGWQPEGVTSDGRQLYVGSLADGAIRRINPRTGAQRTVVDGMTGRVAVGVEYDRRRHLIWVAGGATSRVRAHDARTGKVVRVYRFAPRADRFVNDLVVTRTGVFATDSVNQRLLVVPLHGRALPPARAAHAVRLTGALHYEAGFNLNGIVASRGRLLAVQSNTGKLFRINGATGRTRNVRLGGYSVTNGDGLERDADLLYVVRNQDNTIAVLDLSPRLRRARLVAEVTRADHDFDVPTTVARTRHSMWAVNARFGTPEPGTAQYWLTRFPAH